MECIPGSYKISRYQTRHQSTSEKKISRRRESRDSHRHMETHIYSFRGTYKHRRGSTWPGWKRRQRAMRSLSSHGGRNRKRDGISGNPARVYPCPRVCSPFYSPEMQRKKWGGMQETTWKKLATLFKLGQFSG